MDKDMYFICLLADAFKDPDRETALRQAFEKIKSLGDLPEYRQGYRQFEVFMEFVDSHIKKNRNKTLFDNVLRVLMVELASGMFEGDDSQRNELMELIESRPAWLDQYRRIEQEIDLLNRPFDQIDMFIFRDDESVGKVSLSEQKKTAVLSNLIPGIYKLVLSSGRQLWQGSLEAKDLLWSEAFGKEPLKMAAQTSEAREKPVRTVDILDGEIKLHLFAGLETGNMEVEMNFS